MSRLDEISEEERRAAAAAVTVEDFAARQRGDVALSIARALERSGSTDWNRCQRVARTLADELDADWHGAIEARRAQIEAAATAPPSDDELQFIRALDL